MKRQLLVFLVGSAAFTLSCSSDDPCFPDTQGKEYRVTIQQIQGATPQCPVDFDLVPDSSILVSVERFRDGGGGGCLYGMGKIVQGPDGWTWSDNSELLQSSSAGRFFQGAAIADSGTCHGSIRIAIDANQVPTGKSSLDKAPQATVYRHFLEDPPGQGCPVVDGVCSDWFSAEIAEQ